MQTKYLAILAGGLLPALGLGIAGLFQKLASQSTGTGVFLIVTGLATCFIGSLFLLTERDLTFSSPGLACAFLFGICWALSSGLISFTLRRLGGSLSQLVPIYNTNTLVAVLAGLILLGEWKTVHPIRITLASIFIIIGGVLATRS
jgi:uncharacterized membrane protein